MKKILTLWVALWVLLTCMVTISSAVTIDEVVYTEGRLWADGDVEPLWAVGLRTEVKDIWKGLEFYVALETGQATSEQSKMHTCNIWEGCTIEQMQNQVKEDDTYWNAKIGVGYRFNLLGK